MIKSKLITWIDFVIFPFVFISVVLLRKIRRVGVDRCKYSKHIFMKLGLFPILDHYYEPMFNISHLKCSLRNDRFLPAIDLNIDEQLNLVSKFCYNDELLKFPIEKKQELQYYYHNISFESGDAEYFYNIIRYFKPRRLIEIGSGLSTLLAKAAITKNMEEVLSYNCEQICIEPYEMNWLEKLDVKLYRKRVETMNKEIFQSLQKNDILFIDSSHMIRPQGDVLFEMFEILPILNSGVLIHFHDIFTPKDYLDEWIFKKNIFWNEQYLLESFLSYNDKFRIIGALNYLKNNHFEALAKKCPILKFETYREPGSFWIVKN